MNCSRDDYDVIVIGGGPAGSTAASLVAREGHRVLLLDRDSFPRYHIGESLMPATYWTLKRLGLLERMKASAFPRKHSVQFFSSSGKSSVPFYFSEIDSHESSVSWQVDHKEFDQMLLDNAAESGAEICQRANVREVLFEGRRACGVAVVFHEHGRREIGAPVVVDATGQTCMLSRRLGLKQIDPHLKHASLFTRYRGAVRDEGIDEGATLIMHSQQENVWFWYIPLPDDQVSVGVVGPIDYLLRNRGSDPQAVYDEEVDKCPTLIERVAAAEQVAEVRALRDFSYVSTRIAGDGWVMAGDAFGFLDPIYSTGVFLAMRSGEFAADSILDAFARQDFGAAVLGQHGPRYLAGLEAMRKLVYAYYDPGFHVAKFLRAHPDCREPMVNLLIGNVFRADTDGLFEALGKQVALPEARELGQAT